MPQNLYMEDENLTLYVDVQPLFIDSLENSKNSAAASAQAASQSEQNASSILSSISQYKANIELFYAQAQDNLAIFYNTYKNELISTKNTAAEAIQNLKNTVLNSIDTTFRNALNLLQQTGQNIINQAKDYADQAKDAVDNRVSLEHLNQSKALKTGMVSNDNDALADIISYAHSTFDVNKFTVVGSPIVTSDGIASGFSTSNYLRGTYTLDVTKSWEVRCAIETGGTTATAQNGIWSWASNFVLSVFSGNIVAFENAPSSRLSCTKALQTNSKYTIITGWDTTKYYIKIYDNNHQLYDSAERESTTAHATLTGTYFAIGINGSTDQSSKYNPFTIGSIDLKVFSFISNGVPVFSGNKTGIDTIKSDDYTVVGSPTISADGVASGFSSSNYLNSAYLLDTTRPWTIYSGKVNISSFSAQNTIFCSSYKNDNSNDNNPILVNFQTDGTIRLMLASSNNYGNSPADISIQTSTQVFSINTDYWFKLEFTGTQYILSYSINNRDYTPVITVSSSTTVGAGYIYIGLRLYVGIAGAPLAGSIDLNAFKIYVDGDLVYQPCLKIPYTESKTGSKVVDAVYRSRVNDMAEQFGYANYYTLSDTDFTLPQGELYGMIENLRTMIQQLSE